MLLLCTALLVVCQAAVDGLTPSQPITKAVFIGRACQRLTSSKVSYRLTLSNLFYIYGGHFDSGIATKLDTFAPFLKGFWENGDR